MVAANQGYQGRQTGTGLLFHRYGADECIFKSVYYTTDWLGNVKNCADVCLQQQTVTYESF